MATYNGEKFIEEQIRSVLAELAESDELIIVDDASTDGTSTLVKQFRDHRIRLIEADKNIGYVKTFERSLSEAKGQYVFLSDQDDIWIPGRVQKMVDELNSAEMVVSNCEHFDGSAGTFHDIRLRSIDSTHYARNILGIIVGYRLHWGCAMALRRELLQAALPFPRYMTESHDQWLALVGNAANSIIYLEDDTIRHRLHGGNLTPGRIRGLSKIFRARIVFIRNAFLARSRSAGLRKKTRFGSLGKAD